MIVNRRVFIAKKGRLNEAVDVFRSEIDRVWPARPGRRMYTSNLGPFDTFVVEAEYQSLAEYERILAEGMPRVSPDFWKKWNELTEIGGSNEVWNLV